MASRRNRQHLESWLVAVAPLLLLAGYAVVPAVFAGQPHFLGPARLACVALAAVSLCVALVSAIGGSRRSKRRYKSDIPLSSLETILVPPSPDDPPQMRQANQEGDTTLLVLHPPQRRASKAGIREAVGRAEEPATEAPMTDPTQLTLEQLKQLDAAVFLEACGNVYMERGFIVAPGPQAPFGRILALRSQAADEISWAVCRPSGCGEVDAASIVQLAAAMAEYRIAKAFVMAVDGFSDDVRAVATFNRITLINADMLLIMIRKLTPARFSQVLGRARRQ